jgi:hypothetical protein
MAKKTERILEYLPEQGADDNEYRDWLTRATGCPADLHFEEFIRHGYQLTDACTFKVSVPGGDIMAFRTTQQRLANPATLRSAIVYATHGLLRPMHLSRGEFEDIWVAMITLSNIVDSQTEADETWSWLSRYERICARVTDISFVAVHRFDALQTLMKRPRWGRAQALAAEELPDGFRPVWIVDHQTGEEFVRISELLTFLRHDIGVGAISASALTARIHEIGGDRMFFEVRRGGIHPRLGMYLLPSEQPEDAPEDER